eukprot:TRINITY_DN3175_c0_g1_i1.p1 TRINITY_DN3175_c0_g1~~TRINITY_DN3175_c0_g1_i1.p1  ORF type:complete len:235 (-),score=66.52 TRINITY_DN3175_c0_g1_i1:58-762(-)
MKTTDVEILIVGGGSASGKTSVSKSIVKELQDLDFRAMILSQDSFYQQPTDEERLLIEKNVYNFDHPNSIDWDLFEKCLDDLRNRRECHIPKYDFVTSSRLEEVEIIPEDSFDVIVVEGILVMTSNKLLKMSKLTVLVDTDDDVRLARRILRDVSERGATPQSCIERYFAHVKPMYEEFLVPNRRKADIIIPHGSMNVAAMGVIINHLKQILLNPNDSPRERSSSFSYSNLVSV